jgi:plastocyanin
LISRYRLRFRFSIASAGVLLLLASAGVSQTSTVTAQIVVDRKGGEKRGAKDFRTVVWLEPLQAQVPAPAPEHGLTLVQKNKQFEPRLLVIPVGTAVEFPNHDPFFHNVFSLFDGKRFDLGLYEAGTSRTVHFDRPGISYIFCNIHSQMSAVVIALDTPYHALAGSQGAIAIHGVIPGRYRLEVWHEGSSVDALKRLSREVTVNAADTALGKLTVVQEQAVVTHKNKYGRDYEEPERPSYEPQ